MKRLALILVLAGMAVVPASAFGATGAYNWAADFGHGENAANPSGPWSYMHTVDTTSTDPAGFRLLPSYWQRDGASVWSSEGTDYAPRYQFVQAYPGGTSEAYLHPADNGLTVVGWTAPFTGTAQVAGFIRDRHAGCGDGVSWSLNQGRVVLDSGQIDDGGPDQDVSARNVAVSQGDTLYLIVDPDANMGCDSTTLGFTVALTDDADGDTVPDREDAYPNNPNESVNTDGDGLGNNADTDDDNDGVADGADAFPLDKNESVDTDGDTVGNNADTDDDGDEILDVNDRLPLDPTESSDNDNDGIGDNADTNDDNDNVLDNADDCKNVAGGAQNGCPLPTLSAECKKDGWKLYGLTFKNQGACVSYVETRK